MNKQFAQRIAAGIAVATVCLGVAAPAFADPGDPYSVGGVSQENKANPALINPTADVRLSLTKYLGAPTGVTNDGTQQTITGLPTLTGVNFDVYRVYTDAAHTALVDLTSNAGWQAASSITGHALTPAEVAAGSFAIGGTTYYLQKDSTITTGAGGVATFTKKSGVGLYLVNENLATSGTVTSGGNTVDKASITPSQPFFVTLPMTNPTALNRWMYDVSVYPKNQTDAADKTVKDQGTSTDSGNTGSHTLEYTIRTSITDGMSAATMAKYVVTDPLDPRLAYVGAAVAIDPDGDPATPATTALTVPQDYTVTTTGDATTGTKVQVSLTAGGLTKLVAANTANPAAKLATVLTTTAKSEGTTGVIANTAYLVPNQAWAAAHPADPGQATPPVESHYGDVIVNKYDPQAPAGSPANMAGAEFSLYRDANTDGKCDDSDIAGATAIAGAVVAKNANASASTTDHDDYVARFTGVQASNFYDGKQQTALRGYCVVETKAPSGYNLDATPRFLTLDYATATASAVAFASVDVANEQSNLGNSLPLTGGRGIAAISALGVVLVGGGGTYYVASNRRRRSSK